MSLSKDARDGIFAEAEAEVRCAKGKWAIIILFVQVSNRNENSLKSNFLPQKVHKSFMCNVTDVKQTMAYLNFAFITNLQFSVCLTVTKTTLI